jgi:hypothetical protein
VSAAIHIFAGPSLPAGARPALADAVFHGPAAQGDVYAVARHRPFAIGLIDGYFERIPAVWHKEILWALSEGVHVFGAASMGALRAAELAAFGMVGVGRVYEDFACGQLTDDDEVTLVHADADQAYRPLSEAMVNIRATVASAARGGILSPEQAATLIATAKQLFYPDRSFPALLEAARGDLPHQQCQRLAAWLSKPANRIDQKRLDALELVRAVCELRDLSTERKSVSWVFRHTDAWEQVRRAFLPRLTAFVQGEADVGARAVNAPPERAAHERARLRALEIELAKRDGFRPGTADLELAVEEYCRSKGLTTTDALVASLEAGGVSWAEFERLMHDQACVRRSRLVMSFDVRSLLADIKRLASVPSDANETSPPHASVD